MDNKDRVVLCDCGKHRNAVPQRGMFTVSAGSGIFFLLSTPCWEFVILAASFIAVYDRFPWFVWTVI